MAALPNEFVLEKYFAEYEFNTKYLLCCSDAETLSMEELVDLADDECKHLWKNLKLGYTESRGHPLLLKEIASFHGMNEEDVIVFAPQEGIYVAMRCLFDYLKRQNNDQPIHAVVTNPAYQSLQENLRNLNCEMDLWTVKELKEGWQFLLDDLNASLKPNTKLLVVNFPHNPTGFNPPAKMWEEIINICKEKKIFLFSDEMYRMSNNDGTGALPSACTVYNNAITLCGMSKTLALPGLRIGWLCTKNTEIMEMFASFKDYLSICSAAPSEVLSIIGLRQYKYLVDRTVSTIKTNLDVLDDFVSRHSDLVEWHRPTACTTGVMRIKSWLLDFPGGGASGFCDVLVKEAEVLLAPANMFGMDGDYVRVGFGRKNMPEALQALEAFIVKHTPK